VILASPCVILRALFRAAFGSDILPEILTKDVLYRLSYASVPDAGAARGKSVKLSGGGAGLKGAGVAS